MFILMLFYGKFDLKVICKGDIYVDDYYSVEDIGIVIGEVFKNVLGDKKGIWRYFNIYIFMDEFLLMVVIDISNRFYFVFNVKFDI